MDPFIFKTFRDMDLGRVSDYEIMEYGYDLPPGIKYHKRNEKYIGFKINSIICEQYDMDLFLENFYNFITDLRDCYTTMLFL